MSFILFVDFILPLGNKDKARLWIVFIVLLFITNFVLLSVRKLKLRQDSRASGIERESEG